MQLPPAPTTERSFAPILVIATTVLVLGLALFFMLEAVEERDSASAASDLRAASLTMASADALIGTPLESTTVNLDASIAIIEGDHDSALHSLSPQERTQAETLLMGVTRAGHVGMHSAGEHTELQRLLTLATEQSEAEASLAARRAAGAILAALITLAAAATILARAQNLTTKRNLASASEAALANRIETLLNDLPDMLFVIDDAGLITYRSNSTNLLLPADATLRDVLSSVLPEDRDRMASHLRARADTPEIFEIPTSSGSCFLDVRVTDLANNEHVDGHLVTARDVTAELQLRTELQEQASIDMLTGLLNRRALDPALACAQQRAQDGSAGFLLVDFDEFKEINDTLGHLAGDQLLREAAARMKSVLRPDETLLRLGGDEFAVVIAPIASSEALVSVGERIRTVMGRSFALGDTTERLRTSVGAAVLDGPFEPDQLLAKADIALYEAKELGGNRLVLFEPAMEERAAANNNIMRALRSMEFDEEFSLVFQPIYDASSRDIVSLEALLRWHSPTLGFVGPGDFIPVAEKIGIMPQVGDWVLQAVCRQVAEWDQRGLDKSTTISFNVSAQQLQEPNFVRSVFTAIQTWNIPAERLVIEVTESMVIEYEGDIIERLSRLRDGGVQISIDDFGSGYSNLGQLLGVPLDIIKIDRDLLLRLGEMRDASGGDPSGSCSIMRAIVSIAQMLDAPVVCEGVETDAQSVSLQASGVKYLQGYLLSRPRSPEDLLVDLFPANTEAQPELVS